MAAINNNLNILIDPAFTNVNRLFVLSYQVGANNNDNGQPFSQFCLPNIMVKDYNVIIDKLAFFDLPIKNEEEAYEKIIGIRKNNEYTTGNFLDFLDLIQQSNFIERLEQAANVFIIIEKKEHTILEFSQNFANVLYK